MRGFYSLFCKRAAKPLTFGDVGKNHSAFAKNACRAIRIAIAPFERRDRMLYPVTGSVWLQG
ncbi:hypothetical protein C3408_10965 [Candidatus Pantoea alvi]|nr:hypothetical protein C3408_10965 [Pantoea alvi]